MVWSRRVLGGRILLNIRETTDKDVSEAEISNLELIVADVSKDTHARNIRKRKGLSKNEFDIILSELYC
jgi:hypothetical protein